MAGSTFGKLFRVTTWGESHGKGIGVVIDGCQFIMKPIEGPLTKANIIAPERLKIEPKILAIPCICFTEMLSTLTFNNYTFSL